MDTHSSVIALPRILLITTRRWHFASRLAMRFAEAGCEVDIVCPHRHSIRHTSVVRRVLLYRALMPQGSIMRAIRLSDPQLLVPCDDDATALLHHIGQNSLDDRLRRLITVSIGPQTSFDVTQSRVKLQELCVALDVPVPRAANAHSYPEFEQALAKIGLPAYLKTDGSSGGSGVRVIRSIESAQAIYSELAAPPSLARAFKRALIDGDHSLLLSALRRRRPAISLHQAISGHEANHSVFCWQGLVQASVTMQVVVAANPSGPSTVVRHSPDRAIEAASAAIVRRLNLSGFYGFDFIVASCPITGNLMPHLIELNARATPTSHLALGAPNDLVASVVAVLTASTTVPQPPVTTNALIALFPGELLRDATSQYLHTAYHDVPHSEPALIEHCARQDAAWKRWFTYRAWYSVVAWIERRINPRAVRVGQPAEPEPVPSIQPIPLEIELSYPEATEIA